MLTIHYTTNFVKKWKKLKNKDQLRKRIEIFRENPFDIRLKTHKLKNKLEGYWAFSINYKERVLFGFKTNIEVIFYDFGSHDIYK